MTQSTPHKLAYQAAYNRRPRNIVKREMNNAARRQAIRDGRAQVGDGTDVAHLRSLEHGGDNSPGNLRVQSRKTNRGWRKGSASYNPDKRA